MYDDDMRGILTFWSFGVLARLFRLSFCFLGDPFLSLVRRDDKTGRFWPWDYLTFVGEDTKAILEIFVYDSLYLHVLDANANDSHRLPM